jgi:hypothetical protein
MGLAGYRLPMGSTGRTMAWDARPTGLAGRRHAWSAHCPCSPSAVLAMDWDSHGWAVDGSSVHG